MAETDQSDFRETLQILADDKQTTGLGKILKDTAGENLGVIKVCKDSCKTDADFIKKIWEMDLLHVHEKKFSTVTTMMSLAKNKMKVNLHGLSGSGASDLVRRTIYNCDPQRETYIDFIVGTDSHRGVQTVVKATVGTLGQIFGRPMESAPGRIGIYTVRVGPEARIRLVKPDWLPLADPDKSIQKRRVLETKE